VGLAAERSPAFGNPARSRLSIAELASTTLTPVGFAALVHTRCAFIVSGTASNNGRVSSLLTQSELSNLGLTMSSIIFQPYGSFLPDGSDKKSVVTATKKAKTSIVTIL
jgi:hypothetical protein